MSPLPVTADPAPARLIPAHPVWFVRHGQTSWNVEGRSQGHRDSPLTPLGLEQAARIGRHLARLLAGRPDLRLVASHLGRAQHTARLIAGPLGLEVETDPRLAEVSFGAWEGMTRAEIARAFPDSPAGAGSSGWQFLAPGGETYAKVVARLTDWVAGLSGPTIAVSHGMVGRILRGLCAGLSREAALALSIPQDRIFLLGGAQEVEEIKVEVED